MAVRAGVVDRQKVARFEAGEGTVDRELVVVFAERAGHVVELVARRVFLAEHRDVMVGAVERGAHEVGHAGVEPRVFLVGVLHVQDARDEPSARTGDRAPAFHAEPRRRDAVLHEDVVHLAPDAGRDGGEIHLVLLRAVGDAHAAAQIDELERDAERLGELRQEREDEARGLDEVFGLALVGGDHRVDAEALHAELLHRVVALEHLLRREAVFGLLGAADDRVALLGAAGVEARAHEFRQPPERLADERDVRKVVEVEDRAHARGLAELFGGRVVAREHHRFAAQAGALGEHQLRERRAVRARAGAVLQKREDRRIRRRLHRKVVAEAGAPRERVVEGLGARENRGAVVNVERRRRRFFQLEHPPEREGELLRCHDGRAF